MKKATKQILFVEDEPIAQTIYGNRLKREGFDVLFAQDGQAALETLSQVRPDLVVLDLMLPKVPGAEVLKRIRSDEGLKNIPVLILSNAYISELTQKAMESGATTGMLKSECTPASLIETVRKMLGYTSAFELSETPQSAEEQIEAFTAAAENALEDEIVLKKTREEFIEKTPAEVAKFRELSQSYIKAAGTSAGQEPLNRLHESVRFFATRAGMAGCTSLAILASAFEALLYECLHKPGRATPSTSQTIAQAIDCLERLFQNTSIEEGKLNLQAKILVVDDDPVCNLAMVSALKRANFHADCVQDPVNALEMASNDIYDIMLLDINMPGMDGFQLCEKIRQMAMYQVTPIIFVTSTSDFQSRTRGILSGGNDLIPKPVSPVELILKITLHLLRPSGAWAETSALASVLKTSMRLLQGEARETQASVPARDASLPEKKSPATKSTEAPIPFTIKPPLMPEMPVAASVMKQPVESTQPVQPAAVAASIKTPEKLATAPVVDEPVIRAPEKPTTVEVKAEAKVEEPKMETPAVATDIVPPLAAKTAKPATDVIKDVVEKTEAAKAKEAAKTEVPAAKDVMPLAESLGLPNVIPFPTDSKPKQHTINMETKQKPTFEEATRGVARIIFGDENINDMNVRLTRIALERYNVPGTQSTDEISRGVARIIFGDDKLSDMNVRLTRIALESYNITEVLGANGHKKPVENGVAHAANS
ncbi:MAG TPA: response regulator [Verrucomicrobiae bacterium]|jgi:DNA-binding response OmpR family regulator